jgi:hypothetical protein
MTELEQKLSSMTYDDLCNLGIRLANIIERGKEYGATSRAETHKLHLVDRIIKDKERQLKLAK